VERSSLKANLSQPPPVIDSDGLIPAWAELPFEILLEIMDYAAVEDRPWLMRAACKVCRAFAEPAITSFYRAPTLPTANAVKQFCKTLMMRPSEQFTNYNVKVKRLEVGSRQLDSAFPTLEIPRLGSMLASLPQLTSIFITSPSDHPPFRVMHHHKWYHPIRLLAALDESDKRIKGWRWNAEHWSNLAK